MQNETVVLAALCVVVTARPFNLFVTLLHNRRTYSNVLKGMISKQALLDVLLFGYYALCSHDQSADKKT